MVLTDAGQRVAPRIAGAFDTLDAAFAQLRVEDESLLTVSTTQTFAGTWLAWRIGGFQLVNPATAVRLDVDDSMTDFARDAIDAAIRSGRGPWPGLAADLLLSIDFTPMCSPDFLARHEPMLDLPLIVSDDPWWPWWLREAGVAVPDGAIRTPSIRMDSQSNQGNAAIAGQGIAMPTPFLQQNDMADGRLVQLFPQLCSRGYGYWLVVPEHRRQVLKIRRFRDWLLGEIGRTGTLGR